MNQENKNPQQPNGGKRPKGSICLCPKRSADA